MTLMKPSKVISKAREHASISQRTLAERAGIALRTVGNIENGRTNPSSASLAAVSRALGYLNYSELSNAVGQNALRARLESGELIPIFDKIVTGFNVGSGSNGRSPKDYLCVGHLQRHLIDVDDLAAFGAVIHDEAMMPELAPREIVICSPDAAKDNLATGAIYAIQMELGRKREGFVI